MNIGQEIRKRRQELRLTQQSLADMSGVSVRAVIMFRHARFDCI